MRAILNFDFQKKKTITFFWSKLSKLHKKDPILHVATTFSLKQGETRTSHGPIPHPLKFHSVNEPMRKTSYIACLEYSGIFLHHQDLDLEEYVPKVSWSHY